MLIECDERTYSKIQPGGSPEEANDTLEVGLFSRLLADMLTCND